MLHYCLSPAGLAMLSEGKMKLKDFVDLYRMLDSSPFFTKLILRAFMTLKMAMSENNRKIQQSLYEIHTYCTALDSRFCVKFHHRFAEVF